MVEDNEENKNTETEQEGVVDNNSAPDSVVDRGNVVNPLEEAKRLNEEKKELLDREEKLLNRKEKLHAMQMVGGHTVAGQEGLSKEDIEKRKTDAEAQEIVDAFR